MHPLVTVTKILLIITALMTPHHHHHGPCSTVFDSTAHWPAHAKCVAAYINGDYKHDIRKLKKHHDHVLTIDVNASDPRAGSLDIEPGDATPSQAASWVRRHEHVRPGTLARLYFPPTEFGAVRRSVHHLPGNVRRHVRYWIASPTGHRHQVDGTSATQYRWGNNGAWDVTACHGDFMAGTGTD